MEHLAQFIVKIESCTPRELWIPGVPEAYKSRSHYSKILPNSASVKSRLHRK